VPSAPAGTGSAAAPVVTRLHAPSTVAEYERFEVTGTITPEPANPFDPAQIDVRIVLRAPDQSTHRAIGFYYQGFRRRLIDGAEQLQSEGEPVWKTRFAPTVAGLWKWRWVVMTPGGSTGTEWHDLRVLPSENPGYVRRSARDAHYLAFDDASPYFAIGENTGWYDDRGTFAYDDWFKALARQRATYGRIWMSSWAFGIEWKDTGLGDYRDRLDRAWQLDQVLEEAERRGIYVALSLLNHGAFSTLINSEWADNPYNVANGGPLASPGEFFTNDEARALFEQRLRYVVARWGYSTHVLAWELWNEAELTDGYVSAASVDWHREMADELRRLDPVDHLVTTSFALAGNDPAVWADAGLDYTQLHAYARVEFNGRVLQLFSNIAAHVQEQTATRLAETDTPVLFAELGVDARGPAETEDADPDGLGIHDGLWAGALSGGAGTAMTWWWDNLIDVQPRRYYPMFGSVARFLDGVAWDREQLGPATASAESPSRPLVVYGLQGSARVLAWIKDDAYQWNTPERVRVADAMVTIDALARGRWCGSWWDTWKGRAGPRVKVDGVGTVVVEAPPFVGDVALRLQPCRR
jgi:Domain of unknown function (DUF5060)/Cellulase (glycosyl hydrolase family 5)